MLTDPNLRFIAQALVKARADAPRFDQANLAIDELIDELGLDERQRDIFEAYLGGGEERTVVTTIDAVPDSELPWGDLPEGATATCLHCGREILLDQREGGGPGKDWGDGPATWVGNGGIGMDYGCDNSPLNDAHGTGGHVPDVTTIVLPGEAP